jgi:hypothetical protein
MEIYFSFNWNKFNTENRTIDSTRQVQYYVYVEWIVMKPQVGHIAMP